MASIDDEWIERARRTDLALLLDLDGTLIPFADSVATADLDRAAVNLLGALAFSGVRVVIVSGRPLEHLERVRGAAADAWWVAEHGAWCRSGDEWSGPTVATEIDALVAMLGSVASVPGTLIERKSLGVCVHWRRVARTQRGEVIDATEHAFAAWLAQNTRYERLTGIEALEVRDRSVTKGRAVSWVRERIPNAHVIAIGDDTTDEDMFAALSDDEMSIVVRNSRARETRARAALSDPTAVRGFLWWIVDSRTQPNRSAPAIEMLSIDVCAR